MAIPGRLRSIIAFLALAALVAGFLLAAPDKAEAQTTGGILYTIARNDANQYSLYSIAVADESVSYKGALGLDNPHGLATIGSILYTADQTTRGLYTVNTVNGSTTLLCTVALKVGGLAGLGTTLYMVSDTGSSRDTLYSLDPSDCSTSAVSSTTHFVNRRSLGTIDPFLYSANYSYQIRRIDPSVPSSVQIGTHTGIQSPAGFAEVAGQAYVINFSGTLYEFDETSVSFSNGFSTGVSHIRGLSVATVIPCTASLSPVTNLGTLGSAPDAQIIHAATIVRGIDTVPCGNGGTAYFSVTLEQSGAVGFTVDGVPADYYVLASSSYTADLADCGGGANTCRSSRSAAGADDFGGIFNVTSPPATYTFYIETGYGEDTQYTLAVKRLVPQFVEVLTTSDTIVSTWDVGAPSEFLEMRVDHRRQKAADWTTGTDYAGPTAGVRVVENTINDLVLDDFALRGVFRHAPDSHAGEGLASTFPQVWGFPPGNMAIEAERVGDLDIYRYSVIASWQFPQVRFTDWDDEEVDWSFLLRYNDTEIDVGQTRRAVVFVDEPGGLKVDVRARFACPESTTDTDECQLRVRGWVSSYAGDEDHDYFSLPQGVTVLTLRSDAASVYIDPDPRVVETELVDQQAIPPVVDAISGFLAIAGVAPESRRPEVWAFLVCLVAGIAIGGGLGLATTAAGHTTAALFAGAFAFFLWWSLLGPEWFGIPPFFAYGTVAAPILATGIFIVARARL